MYTTKEKIEAYLGKSLTQTQSQIESIIAGIDQYIDNFTNRTFDKTTATKYFDGNGRNSILIDDLLSFTRVELADKYADNFQDITDDVIPYPTEAPHFKLIYKGILTSGYQNVKIVGEWGFNSVPKDIEFVSTVLSAGALTEPSGAVKSERIGNYQVSYGEGGITDYNSAMAILKSRKRYYL